MVAGYEVNIHNQSLSYIPAMDKCNLKLKAYITNQTMKFLGINVTQQVQDLYVENHKTLRKEVKQLNKWRDTLCSWIEKLNIVKMLVPLNLTYRFKAIAIKTPTTYFVEKLILNLYEW